MALPVIMALPVNIVNQVTAAVLLETAAVFLFWSEKNEEFCSETAGRHLVPARSFLLSLLQDYSESRN